MDIAANFIEFGPGNAEALDYPLVPSRFDLGSLCFGVEDDFYV